MKPRIPTPALYSIDGETDWTEAEIVDRRHGRLVLREVGKLWPGVFLAETRHVAILMRPS